VKLGAGGLVRAYTDSVAQALLTAEKIAIIKLRTLACSVSYALEGTVRRELEAAGASLGEVQHGAEVHIEFTVPADAADALAHRLNEGCHGRLAWRAED
jgi:putative IMPACT (imprinted ancient) family translation regulator